MADNYLEKQYERYQARKAAWEKERKYGKKKKSVHPRPFRRKIRTALKKTVTILPA